MTLLEVLIAVSVLAVTIATPALLLSGMSDASRTEWTASRQSASASRALEFVEERLRTADPSSVSPWLTGSLSTDVLDFQRVVAYAGGPVLGPLERIGLEPSPEDPVNGVDDDGDGVVDERLLVWREAPGQPSERRAVLCGGVLPAAPGEVLGNGIDDDGDGLLDEAGLAISIVDGALRVRLDVAGSDGDGHVLTQSFARTIAFRGDV